MLREAQEIKDCKVTLSMDLNEARELKAALGLISRTGEIKYLYNWLNELIRD